MPEALSADQARRMALRAQGFAGAKRASTVAGLVQSVAAVQLDTISVLARSHELVCYARSGPVPRASIEAAYWGQSADGTARCVEYWAHAACILPADSWPWFAFRRRRYRQGGGWWRTSTPEERDAVLALVQDQGPLTATDLGGAKQGGPWWDWSPMKVAAERLLAEGRLVCSTRRGWRRVYDLPERALPAEVLSMGEPDDDECLTQLVATAGRCLGVATTRDLADYFRLEAAQVNGVVAASGLLAVEVQGWPAAAWADPDALEAVDKAVGRHRTTLLSPFDSLVWDRTRTKRLFGFEHRLEAYTPGPKRVHGYFAMPLLHRGRLVGRVDPARRGRTLVAKQVSVVKASDLEAMAAALREAATWVGCDSVEVLRMDPEYQKARLTALLA